MTLFFVERLIYNDHTNGHVDFGCDHVWKALAHYNKWESDENIKQCSEYWLVV